MPDVDLVKDLCPDKSVLSSTADTNILSDPTTNQNFQKYPTYLKYVSIPMKNQTLHNDFFFKGLSCFWF